MQHRASRCHIVALMAAVLFVPLVAGCSRCEAEEPRGTPQVGGDEARSDRPTAVIEGSVRLEAGAELPGWPINPMVAPPGRPRTPEQCPPAQPEDQLPVRRVASDRLTGVIVTLGDFETEPAHEPQTHEVFIRDCRLTPPIVVATRGDHLRLTNETDYPFLPDFGTGLLNALLHGESREVELARGGMRTLQCGFSEVCGRTEVVTLYHPLHDITDDEGRFRIEGVPANDELRIAAWHPLFSEAGETLTLEPGETRRIEIVLRPNPSEPPSHAEDAPGRAEDNPDVLF